MQLYVVRHQQSVANTNNIIQGPEDNSPLTQQGKNNARKLADRIYEELVGQQVYRVVSSPLERATQTARIIADRLGVPVVYDDSLVEFDPGILAGPKDQAAELYPQHLEIWNQRGDLDGIFCAEKGDDLQARSIYFLERYMDADKDLIEIVVSHAGFNRSMVNTATSNPRNYPIGHEHDQIHIIKDPWQTIDVKRLELAKASQSYRIKTPDQTYVMKRIFGATEEDMQFQYKISAHVAKDGELLSRVLYWGMRPDHAVQVLNFLKGNHVYGTLTTKQKMNLLSASYELGQRLKTAPSDLRKIYNHTLKDKIEDCIADLDDSPIRRIGRNLLDNPRYRFLVSEVPDVVVHYDLHRSNILFTEHDDVRVLDLGSFLYAPKSFLPASLFMSFYMLEEQDDFSLDQLINYWPEKLNKQDITILMQARAIIGSSFFQKKISKNDYSVDDYEIFKKYLNSLKIIDSI